MDINQVVLINPPTPGDQGCPHRTLLREADRDWHNLQSLLSVKPFALLRKELLLRSSYLIVFGIFFLPFPLNCSSQALHWAKRGQSPRSNNCHLISPAALLPSAGPFFLNCCLIFSIKSGQGTHFPWSQLYYKPVRGKKSFCWFNSLELLNWASPKRTHRKWRKKGAVWKSARKKQWNIFSCLSFLKKKNPKQIIPYLQLEHSSNTLYFELAAGIKPKIKINVFLEWLMGAD